jgi:hypothetical protein
MERMNVYEKLATARVEFQKRNPKMSGQNKFAGYSYFELSDILPAINQIGMEIGFVTVVSFTKDTGSLLFIDSEKPTDVICFESPMSTASLKGCHEVQNLGAVETYVKRYLYQNAFEIVESDALNSTHNPDGKPEQKKDAPEIIALKQALIDYINAGAFEHPENVERVIKEKNIVQMRRALEIAKEKESENNK